jgi:hypothetical protein
VPLRAQLGAWSDRLRVDFEQRTTGLGQNLDRGEARESVLRGFLRHWLPAKCEVGNGEMVAASGARSRQCDVVIFDGRESPLIFRSSDGPQVYPIEVVYGTVEVKSTLDSAGVADVVSKNASVRGLPRAPVSLSLGAAVSTFGYAPIGAGFAFSAINDVDALLTQWSDANRSLSTAERSQVLCVLGRGCLLYVSPDGDFDLSGREGSRPVWVAAGDSALLLFFLSLVTWISEVPGLRVPNLVAYAGGSLTFEARQAPPL